MSIACANTVQCGRRRGSSRNGRAAEVKTEANSHVDLHQVTVLPKADWLRIQDSLNRVDKQREQLIAAVKQREALHLRSKEVVKTWTNTLVGQRQQRLQAKKLREDAEEEEKKLIDIEEAKYQDDKRKEAIEKAKTLLYYQADRVKEFHGSFMLTEVLKEREAQIELKEKKQKAAKELEKEFIAMVKNREAQALELELQKALREKEERLAIVQSLKQQINVHEEEREQERLNKKKEAEELQQLLELCLKERSMYEEKKQLERMNTMKAHQEYLANKKAIKAAEAQKQIEEDERQRLQEITKAKMMKLRKEKDMELKSEVQRQRQALAKKVAARVLEQHVCEDKRLDKAVEEAEAKFQKAQRDKEQKKAAMLQSIAEHRAAVKQDEEQRERDEKQKAVEMLNAKKAADIIFLQKMLLKAQMRKEDALKLQDTHVQQMAYKRAQEELLKKQNQEYEARNAELIAEEEKAFQRYAKEVIQAASEAQRDTYPLRRVAGEHHERRLSYGGSHDQHPDFQKSKKQLGLTH